MRIIYSFICLTGLFFVYSEPDKCTIPRFHQEIRDVKSIAPHVIYRSELKTRRRITMYYSSENKTSGGPYVRVLTSKYFQNWEDVTEKMIPKGKYPDGSFLQYAVNDKYDTTGLFRGKSGDIVAFYGGGKYSIFTVGLEDENVIIEEVCPECGKSESVFPSHWITPVYSKPMKKWISADMENFVVSGDLQKWVASFPTADTMSQSATFFIKEIFSISLFGEENEVRFVAIYLDGETSLQNYFVFDFERDSVKILSEKTRFDYGPDLGEVAVIEGCDYGKSVVTFIGTIWSINVDVLSSCWPSSTSFVRQCKLRKTSTGYSLTISPLPVREDILFKVVNEDKTFDESKEEFLTQARFFKLKVRTLPKTATLYGLEIFKSPEGSTKIYHDLDKKQLCVDRSNSTKNPVPYEEEFYKKPYCAPAPLSCDGYFEFVAYADGNTLEIFGVDGSSQMTFFVFSPEYAVDISLFSNGKVFAKEITVSYFTLYIY